MRHDWRFAATVSARLRHRANQVQTLHPLNLKVNVWQCLAHDIRRVSAASELLAAICDQPVFPK